MYKLSLTFDDYTIEVSNSGDVGMADVFSDFKYLLKGFGKTDEEIMEYLKNYASK